MSYKAFISYSHAADGQLAPLLQQALQKFAKPFYRRRAIEVFRDQTSLQLTPALWPEIQRALRDSEYFVLLASPESAQSEWVRREIDEWVGLGAVGKLLIVLTGGSIAWDAHAGDFDWKRTDALPHALARQFASEPLHGDVRSIKAARDVSLRNPDFLNEVATLAAALRGIPRDQLIGADVRQHRIFRGTVVATLVVLLALGAGATWQAVVATRERARAEAQTEVAEAAARSEAAAKTRAEQAAEQERAARRLAEENLRQATARRLAAQAEQSLTRSDASDAIGASDPQRGVLLALESLNQAQTPEGSRALRNAFAKLTGEKAEPAVLKGQSAYCHAVGPEAGWVSVSPDPTTSEESTPWFLDPRTGKRLPRREAASTEPRLPDGFAASDISANFTVAKRGSWLVAEARDGGLDVWNVGAKARAARLPAEETDRLALSDDGRWAAAAGQSGVSLWQVAVAKLVAQLPHEWGLQAMQFTDGGNWLTTVTADVSKDSEDNAATVLVGSTIRVWDTATGNLILYEPLAAHGGITSARFSPDGRWLVTTSPSYQKDQTRDSSEPSVADAGTILRVWRLDMDDLGRAACAALRRNLSESEWTTFLGSTPFKATCPVLARSREDDSADAHR